VLETGSGEEVGDPLHDLRQGGPGRRAVVPAVPRRAEARRPPHRAGSPALSGAGTAFPEQWPSAVRREAATTGRARACGSRGRPRRPSRDLRGRGACGAGGGRLHGPAAPGSGARRARGAHGCRSRDRVVCHDWIRDRRACGIRSRRARTAGAVAGGCRHATAAASGIEDAAADEAGGVRCRSDSGARPVSRGGKRRRRAGAAPCARTARGAAARPLAADERCAGPLRSRGWILGLHLRPARAARLVRGPLGDRAAMPEPSGESALTQSL